MFGLVQRALAAVVTLGAVLMLGCGPTIYINQVTRRANAAVAAAKTANAEKYAPYHYTLAIEYLHKAREEAAHADYQAANRFGRMAEEAAVEAEKLAVANAADPDYQPPEKIRGDADTKAGDGAGAGTRAGDDGGMAPLLPTTGDGDDGGDGDGTGTDKTRAGPDKTKTDSSGGQPRDGGMAPLLPDDDADADGDDGDDDGGDASEDE